MFAPQRFKYSYEACSSDLVPVPMCYVTDKPATDGTTGKAASNYASGVCPFDPKKEGDCMLHQKDACACINHGAGLHPSIYMNTDYKNLKHIAWYGTSCVAWDRIPETPWREYCPSDADFCTREDNWCVLPWCYVSQACPTAKKTDVFAPKDFYYSYETCGGPNCYEKTTRDELFGVQKVCPAWADCPNGETTSEQKCVLGCLACLSRVFLSDRNNRCAKSAAVYSFCFDDEFTCSQCCSTGLSLTGKYELAGWGKAIRAEWH